MGHCCACHSFSLGRCIWCRQFIGKPRRLIKYLIMVITSHHRPINKINDEEWVPKNISIFQLHIHPVIQPCDHTVMMIICTLWNVFSLDYIVHRAHMVCIYYVRFLSEEKHGIVYK
ncbi:hypothetical protein AMTRI_Chr01g133910 [Amborella trichopoda]